MLLIWKFYLYLASDLASPPAASVSSSARGSRVPGQARPAGVLGAAGGRGPALGQGWGGPGRGGRPRRSHVARGLGQSRSSSASLGGRALQGVPGAGTAGVCARDPGAGTRSGDTARWVAWPGGWPDREGAHVVSRELARTQLARASVLRGAPSGSSSAVLGVQAVKAGVRAWPPATSSARADGGCPGAVPALNGNPEEAARLAVRG